MQLEKMDAFFQARLDGYEAHMLNNIQDAQVFYPFTARQLPDMPGAEILDLGCGTGLELDFYFRHNPDAKVTGIDLSQGMLDAFRKKHPKKALNLICGSYLHVPLGQALYDAAVSVESLHHFTLEEKIPLYTRLYQALKPGGYFILTDFFAASEAEEQALRAQLEQTVAQQGLDRNELYHFDTPLTPAHEILALKTAGFASVGVLGSWGATYTLKARKGETP